MVRRFLLAVAAAVLVLPLFADVLPFDTVSRRLYLLRGQPTLLIDIDLRADRALWSYDDVEQRFERIAPFRYERELMYLGALEDRIVAQGGAYFELDVASGRFLRRYEAIHDARGWIFTGAVVPESIAPKLGVEPGTYGFFRCPPGPGITGIGCSGPSPDPPDGETGSLQDRNLRRLLQRPLDPERTEFKLVGELETDPATRYVAQRYITVDPHEARFLLWSSKIPWSGPSPIVHELSSVTVHGVGTVSESLLRREADPDSRDFRISRDFAFVARARTAFHLMYRAEPSPAQELTKRPLESLVETPVEVTRAPYVAGQTIVSDAITGLPGTLPERYEQLIPIVGDAPGANGTYWRSDLWLFNPSDEVSAVDIRRVTRPGVQTRVTIPAHGSIAIANVLRHLGGDVSLDALVLTSPYRWGAQISAYSRAYTHSTAPGEEGGTFGQAVPAVPTRIGYSNHVSTFNEPLQSTPSHLILDRENPGQFRHNLGVVNDWDDVITVRLASNSQVEQSFTVAPHSVANVNLDLLFPGNVQRLRVAADRPAAMWLSMIDNRTGDATFVPFTLFGVRGVPESYTAVPGVARTRGANGTWWWTDLYGEFRSVDAGEVWHEPRARLQAAGCSSDPTPLVGGGHFFRDVVRLAGCDQTDRLGALELRTSSWTAGFTRTYTTRPDGGTYGEMLPFYPYAGWPVQHFAGVVLDDQFRVNVGLYNGMARSVTYSLRLYAVDGALAHESTVTLAPGESRQASLQTWFATAMEHGLYGLTVVPLDEAESQGRSWAYVALVDNVTNDPTNWW